MKSRRDFRDCRIFRPRLDISRLSSRAGNAAAYQVRWAIAVIAQYNALRRAGIAPMPYPSEEQFRGRKHP